MASLMSEKQHRKKAREAVLQALYAKHVSSEDEKKVLQDINDRYQFDKPTGKFVDELFKSTIKNLVICIIVNDYSNYSNWWVN